MKQEIVVQSSKWFRSVLLLVVIGGCFSLAAPRALAIADSRSCSANSEDRQLDFLVGDWSVTAPGMTGNAMSNVSLSLDKCLFTESWDGGKGHSGKNMFAYSADDKVWHGMFTDNRVASTSSKEKLGKALRNLLAPAVGPNGQTVLNRIKVVRVNPNKVQQSWEKSTDNGTTWTMEFSGEYSRKNI